MHTHTHTYHKHVQYTQEFESVKNHVIKTVKQLHQGSGDVDADSVVEYIRQDQTISTDVLDRYQVAARLVAQEYLDHENTHTHTHTGTGRGSAAVSCRTISCV